MLHLEKNSRFTRIRLETNCKCLSHGSFKLKELDNAVSYFHITKNVSEYTDIGKWLNSWFNYKWYACLNDFQLQHMQQANVERSSVLIQLNEGFVQVQYMVRSCSAQSHRFGIKSKTCTRFLVLNAHCQIECLAWAKEQW